ncbi:cytochrome b/b6 domain-containing protein [Thalassovita mangrovi]|uniref:Cytochrome B n=1 Tax=Thalassovita mangrovi TaxID=2692236 RepID=A0A6L8LH76_9RHOB|nr:cytochrome b/b6 domain-containing protein [Thalassovita mangrovi]MYM54356.1 cytochrome B [Thalassovita mangrovi]
MTQSNVWDPLVRMTHWGVALGIILNGAIVDKDSNLHETVGYTVLALVGLRLIWGLIGTRHARFRDFPLDPGAAMEQLSDMIGGRKRIHLGHTPLGALMIYNLWASILMICLSGYMMTTNTFWGVEWVEEVHELFANWVFFSAVLHVAAVILESRRTGVNLPRAMVTGVKTLPEEKATSA